MDFTTINAHCPPQTNEFPHHKYGAWVIRFDLIVHTSNLKVRVSTLIGGKPSWVNLSNYNLVMNRLASEYEYEYETMIEYETRYGLSCWLWSWRITKMLVLMFGYYCRFHKKQSWISSWLSCLPLHSIESELKLLLKSKPVVSGPDFNFRL